MPGLPRKYALMGFAKGWKAYRASKRGTAKVSNKKRRSAVMARRRTKAGKKHHFGKRGAMKNPLGFLGLDLSNALGSGIYGAGREYVSAKLQPLTSKLPFGSYYDEAGMILALGLTRKFLGNKIPMVSEVTKAGQSIEWARIGAKLAGQYGGSSSTGTSSGAVIVG